MVTNEMTKSGSDDAIVLDGLAKVFGRQWAVRDLSVRIGRGRSLGLLGLNGAGKTTTIKMMMGLLKPSGGSVRVAGFDPSVDALEVKRRVGYVPEQQFIYKWMRVREAVLFCRAFYPTWNDDVCDRWLKVLDLDPHKKVKHLSKGMVVKLAFVLAVSHEPEVLLLDEPMAGLDPIAREEFLDGVVQTICDRGVTVVFSSHTLGDVQRLADEVGIVHEGRLLVHRDVDELLTNTKRIHAVLPNGEVPTIELDDVVCQRVREREWLVTVSPFGEETVGRVKAASRAEHVEVEDLGLEEIFKDYVRGWRAVS